MWKRWLAQTLSANSPARKLTIDHESAIRALAGTKSLRSWIAGFGVCHQTIQAVLRQVSAV
jgi:hypothetical protein